MLHTRALLGAVYEEDVDAERVRGGRVVDIKPEILSARVIGTASEPRTQSDHIKQFSPPPKPGEQQEYAPRCRCCLWPLCFLRKGVLCTCQEAAQMLKRNPLVRVALREATRE